MRTLTQSTLSNTSRSKQDQVQEPTRRGAHRGCPPSYPLVKPSGHVDRTPVAYVSHPLVRKTGGRPRQGRRLSHLRRAVPQKRPSAGARAASFLRHANANQGGSMDAGRLPMGELVYGRERFLFAVMLLVSLLLYGSLVTLALSDASTGGVFLFYGVLLAFGGFVAHAFALGRIRGNGVLVTERQFPFLQQMVNAHARQLGLTYSPTVYVLESGGILNAFATSCLGGSSSSSMRTSSPWRCGADTRP